MRLVRLSLSSLMYNRGLILSTAKLYGVKICVYLARNEKWEENQCFPPILYLYVRIGISDGTNSCFYIFLYGNYSALSSSATTSKGTSTEISLWSLTVAVWWPSSLTALIAMILLSISIPFFASSSAI